MSEADKTSNDPERRRKIKAAVHVISFILLAVVVGFGVTGNLTHIVGPLGENALDRSAAHFAHTSLNETLDTFATVGGVKVTLDILKSARLDAGVVVVNGDVEVGDALQSVYDLVNTLWGIAGAASTGYVALVLILGAAKKLVDPVFTICAALAALPLIFEFLILVWHKIKKLPGHSRKGNRCLKHSLEILLLRLIAGTLLTAITVTYLVPAAIDGASWLSTAITQPTLRKPIAFQGVDTSKNVQSAEAIRTIPSQLHAISASLLQNATALSSSIVRHIAAYIFDAFIFPLSVLLVLFLVTRATLGSLLFARTPEPFFESEKTLQSERVSQ